MMLRCCAGTGAWFRQIESGTGQALGRDLGFEIAHLLGKVALTRTLREYLLVGVHQSRRTTADNERRIVQHGPRDRETLLHPRRVIPEPPVGRIAHLHFVEKLVDASAHSPPRHVHAA